MFNFVKCLKSPEEKLQLKIADKEKHVELLRNKILHEEKKNQSLHSSLQQQNSHMKSLQEELDKVKFSLPPNFRRQMGSQQERSLLRVDESSRKEEDLKSLLTLKAKIHFENFKNELLLKQIQHKKSILLDIRQRKDKLFSLNSSKVLLAREKLNEHSLKIYRTKKQLDFMRQRLEFVKGEVQKKLKETKQMQGLKSAYKQKVQNVYEKIKQLQLEN